MAWYANDGSGQFRFRQIIGWTEYGSLSQLLGAGYHLTWYTNDGNGTFGPMQIIGRAEYYSLLTADLDGDGDTDILSASSEDNTIALYDNDEHLSHQNP